MSNDHPSTTSWWQTCKDIGNLNSEKCMPSRQYFLIVCMLNTEDGGYDIMMSISHNSSCWITMKKLKMDTNKWYSPHIPLQARSHICSKGSIVSVGYDRLKIRTLFSHSLNAIISTLIVHFGFQGREFVRTFPAPAYGCAIDRHLQYRRVGSTISVCMTY